MRWFVAVIIIVLVFILILFLVSYCQSTTDQKKSGNVIQDNGSISVFFCPRDNCSQILEKEILSASDVKCAFYELNLEEIKQGLRNSNASVLVDEDEYEGYGKKITGYGLMHDKFCILNSSIVTTGSMNPTNNDANRNNNNLLVINSKVLAQNYLAEFSEIMPDETNKKASSKRVKNPKINISGTIVESYFCPEDECERNALRVLNTSNESIYFMTFSFTSDPIGELLVEKHQLGVKVRGVFENRQKSQYSEDKRLNESNIPFIFDRNPNTMHHKVFIVDEKIVITGSYNPTANGNENNDENVLIIHNPDIAKKFMEEFEYVWNYDLPSGGAELHVFKEWDDGTVLGSS